MEEIVGQIIKDAEIDYKQVNCTSGSWKRDPNVLIKEISDAIDCETDVEAKELDVFEYGYDLDDLFVSKMCDELYVPVLQPIEMNCEYREDESIVSSDEADLWDAFDDEHMYGNLCEIDSACSDDASKSIFAWVCDPKALLDSLESLDLVGMPLQDEENLEGSSVVLKLGNLQEKDNDESKRRGLLHLILLK